jgi:hypothetical protein
MKKQSKGKKKKHLPFERKENLSKKKRKNRQRI